MSLAVLRTSIGDIDIIDVDLILPLVGTPTYFIELDSDVAPAGAVEIVFATGPIFRGTVARADIFEGRVRLVAVGGAGGLSAEPELRAMVTAAGYAGTPFVASGELLIGDILDASGEALSGDAVDLVASLSLPRWQRVAGLARHALGALARAWGVSWRVRADGRLWLGEETWPAVDTSNVIEQGIDGADGAIDIAIDVDRPDIQPGVTLAGRRVYEVSYRLDGHGLRARLRYESAAGGLSLADSLSAALGPSAGIYSAAHVARVVAVRADGTADLLCATLAVSGTTGINAVPLRVGLARARQVIPVGAEVVLRFASSDAFPTGDPSQPYCEAIGQDADADRAIGRRGDKVQVGTLHFALNAMPPALVITYVPAGSPYGSPGTPLVITIPGGSVAPPVDSYAIEGWIATGSPEISLRRLGTEEIP